MSSVSLSPSGSAIASTRIIPETKADHPAVTSNSQLLTLTQAANFLNLNPRTLSRWVMNGSLRAFRTGKNFRFELKDILAQVEEVKS